MQPTITRDRTGDVLAVVSPSGPTITFFDAGSYDRLAVLELPAEPHELCFDPDHRLLYCTSTYRSGSYHANTGRSRELTVIDPDTYRIVEVIDLAPEHGPHGLALDRLRGRLYVSVEATDAASGGVVVLDTNTRRPIGRIDTMAPRPHWFAITPDGMRGYSTNKEAPFVSVVDLDAGRLVDRIEVPGSEGLAVSPDGAQLLVAAPKGDFSGRPAAATGIRGIDTATGEITAMLPTEHLVFPVHATSNGLLLAGELRIADDNTSTLGRQRTGQLSVFSTGSHELRGTVEVGQFPLTITSSPDGALGYVACIVSSTVEVIDLAHLRPVATLHVDRRGEAGAHGLAYVPSAR